MEKNPEEKTRKLSTAMRRDPWQSLADPTRRKIIELLAEEPLTINEIADRFSISRPAISKQIKILSESQLLKISQKGRERTCTLSLEGLEEVHDWVIQYQSFWLKKLDDLDQYLKDSSDL